MNSFLFPANPTAIWQQFSLSSLISELIHQTPGLKKKRISAEALKEIDQIVLPPDMGVAGPRRHGGSQPGRRRRRSSRAA